MGRPKAGLFAAGDRGKLCVEKVGEEVKEMRRWPSSRYRQSPPHFRAPLLLFVPGGESLDIPRGRFLRTGTS